MTEDAPRESVSGEEARKKTVEATRMTEESLKMIREKYDLLLELRDGKIRRLEKELKEARKTASRTGWLLVVDDAASTEELFGRYLKGFRVEIVCVAGSDAEGSLRCMTFDVVLIEAAVSLGEEGGDGMALCRRLTKESKIGRLVVMSSRPGDAVRKEAEAMGASFLRKPFGRESLLTELKDVLDGLET